MLINRLWSASGGPNYIVHSLFSSRLPEVTQLSFVKKTGLLDFIAIKYISLLQLEPGDFGPF